MIEKNDDDAKTIMTGLIMTCVPSFPRFHFAEDVYNECNFDYDTRHKLDYKMK